MLPLDKIPQELEKYAQEKGIDTDEFKICLELDLNIKGEFGKGWLIADSQYIYRFDDYSANSSQSFSDIQTVKYPLAELSDFSVENFVSSNRVLAEFQQQTIILGYATNSKKQKIFAMIDIVKRLQKGEKVSQDDDIFEQFNVFCPKCNRRYNDPKRKICLNCIDRGAIYKRIIKYLLPYKKHFAGVMACLALQSLVTLLNPFFGGVFLYNEVLDPQGRFAGNILLGVGAVFMTAVILMVSEIIRSRVNADMSVNMTLDMKMDVFSAMQKLSLSYFNNNQTGRLITRVDYDATKIRAFLTDNMPPLFVNVVTFVVSGTVMFVLQWKLALIVFIPIPLIVIIVKKLFPKLWRAFTLRYRKSSALNAMLGDSLNGIRVVKAFAKEDVETHRFTGYVRANARASLKVNGIYLMIFPVIGLIMSISVKAIWGFGGFMVMGDSLSYGEFLTFIAYTSMIMAPIIFLTNVSESFTEMANSAQRMFEILDAVPEITQAENPEELKDMRGEIRLENVSFSYNPNRPILKNITMTIKAGTSVGLVGHTGAGKSTIANLITRLYDTDSGNIYIDGVNIKQISMQTLRKKMAIVSQEIFLFRGTIADNIRYARPDASMEEVIKAAKDANAHDFIINLPSGYETVVGVGSRSLSGGEQQRISIARALLLDPKVLILDEATAAMDTQTERLIQQALNRLIKGRTTITIAHRLSTLKNCQTLYAIENGEIAESGTHRELIEKKGIYYKLYTLQNQAMKKIICID